MPNKKEPFYYKGKYHPLNPSKYSGDLDNITYRSLWERKVFRYLDEHPSILKWSSEEIIIPYRSPIDSRIHRYFPDVLVTFKTKAGETKTMLWEIKPKKQTAPPVKPSRITKRYIQEVATWGINSEKWARAHEFCAKQGWEFKLITEDDLGIT